MTVRLVRARAAQPVSPPKREAILQSSPPKREAILQAALEVFAEHGVHGVAVPEIAARAGVGTGTIYRFFESKEALVNEVFREKKRALGRRLSADLDRKLPPRALFTEFWRRLVAFVREDPDAFRFLELQDHMPYLDETSRELERSVLSPIANSCKQLQRNGIFRKDMRPEVLMALHWGAFVQLFKAERLGYLTVRSRDVVAACDAAWRMCAEPGRRST
jgi:TetR/AcrR family transcriptional regulator, repressor of fatR-cypB operon